jgi:hypothetical protein
MSARAYSDTTVALLAGPVLALANQGLMYVVNMWACGHNQPSVMHIVPFICVCLSGAAAILSYRRWSGVGRGTEDELNTFDSTLRFLALMALAISIFSSMVILAQWASAVVFHPCARV